jgi:hypothetical protein
MALLACVQQPRECVDLAANRSMGEHKALRLDGAVLDDQR